MARPEGVWRSWGSGEVVAMAGVVRGCRGMVGIAVRVCFVAERGGRSVRGKTC